MRKNIAIYLLLFIFLFTNSLFCQKIIIEKIEKVRNFQITEIYFDYTVSNFPHKNYKIKKILVPSSFNLKKAIYTIFNLYPEYITTKSVIEKSKVKTDKIIAKKYLILDTNYQIVNINNTEYYRFKIYLLKKKTKKNFFQQILEQYKIEFNIGNH